MPVICRPSGCTESTDGRWVADRLTEGGPVLGVIDGARYHTASVQTAGGDLLVLFSDGITEATRRSR